MVGASVGCFNLPVAGTLGKVFLGGGILVNRWPTTRFARIASQEHRRQPPLTTPVDQRGQRVLFVDGPQHAAEQTPQWSSRFPRGTLGSMNMETIRKWLRREPFEPFVLRLSNGEAHEVRHPENVALGKNRIVVVHPETDRVVHCALIHVNNIEALQAA